jgi:thiol-disulfide isomerase/thioredoxin
LRSGEGESPSGAEPDPTPTIDLASLAPAAQHRPVSGSWRSGASGYKDAVDESKSSHAPLVVYFYTDWCGYCRRLDSQYLGSSEMQQFLSTASKVKVNPESGQAERDLANQFGVSGYPAFFVLSSRGGRQQVHPFRDGQNQSPAEFAEDCRRAGG